MATVFCNNCGSDMEETAKFCRRCGHPSSFLEATTKTFDNPQGYEPPRFEAPTGYVNSGPTMPSYMQPGAMAPQAMPAYGQATNGLEPPRKNRATLIIVSVIGLVVLSVATMLGILFYYINREIPVPRPVASTPDRPIPPVPPIPAIPPVPPPPPGAHPPTTDSSAALIYPGAEVAESHIESGGDAVLRLRTSDPASKVAEWYTEKIKPTDKVSILGTTVLTSGTTNVVVTGLGGETTIVVTYKQ